MKKLLLTLLVGALALPAFALDFEYTYEGQTLTYTVIDEETKTVETKDGDLPEGVSGNNVSGNLVIPSSVEYSGKTYTVVSIGNYAFLRCTGLTSVTIGNSIARIGEGAFEDCSSLTSVTIPNSVTEIGYNAFNGCKSLTSVTIPNSVTEICESAFTLCFDLTEFVVAPDNQKFASDNGILYSKDMTKLIQYPIGKELREFEIPNFVTKVGEYAFKGCYLTLVTIPPSVTEINQSAFKSGFDLTEFVVAPGNQKYMSDNGILYSKDMTKLIFFPKNKGQKEFEIPNSVTEICDNAFSNCTDLTSVIIPNSVTTIGKESFLNCINLTSLVIPASVTTIGTQSFFFCNHLDKFEVAADNKNFTIEDGVLYSKDMTKLIFYPCNKDQKEFEIPNSVTEIGDYAFYLCKDLIAVTIPNSVTEIGSNAFQFCTNLTSITIPDSVVRIGDLAFYYSVKESVTYLAEDPVKYTNEIFDNMTLKSTKFYYLKSAQKKIASTQPWNLFVHSIGVDVE